MAPDRLGVVNGAAVRLSRWEIYISIPTFTYVKAKKLVDSFNSEFTQVEPVIEGKDVSKQENYRLDVVCQFFQVF